jgi:hypothetical protein
MDIQNKWTKEGEVLYLESILGGVKIGSGKIHNSRGFTSVILKDPEGVAFYGHAQVSRASEVERDFVEKEILREYSCSVTL